jgi:hypothetical protein
MKVALVCIAKNEDNYIEEWINYHKKLGFDDIFIYQNDWRCNLTLPNVTKIEIDGINKQREAYAHFVKNYVGRYDWVAFFDVDEFLVLKLDKTVKDFLQNYSEYPAVGISWVLFGNNNLDKVDGDYSLVRRFTKRQKDVNNHVKCIVKLTPKLVMDIHNPNCVWVDPHKRVNSGPFAGTPSDDIAQLNHYFCKTEEEFIEKCNRGRADSPVYKRTIAEYSGHNFNDIEDLSAYKFLYK